MKYLTRREVARQYPISFSHLAHLACEGRGPRYAVIGRRAIYLRQDIEDWLSSKMIEPSSIRPKRRRGRPLKSETIKVVEQSS